MSLPCARWLLVRPDGSACALRLSRATGFFDRLRGLLFRPLPEPGQGLWIEPCNAVHSFGMKGPIDVLFIDRAHRVLSVAPALAPWRTAACRQAFSTIELRAGEAQRLRIAAGSHLVDSITDQEETCMSTPTETKRTRAPSRPGRAAAIAAVAAASLVSSSAKADAAANMNLGYDFLDEIRRAERDAQVTRPRAPEPTGPAYQAPAGEQREVDAAATVSSEAGLPVPASAEQLAPEAARPDHEAPASVSPVALPGAERRALRIVDLAEAENLYRGSRFDDALTAFRAITDADPAHAHAWLRIGNILHRKREWFDALSAYRKAARPQADPAIREKAVYNVALLNLELARQAMKRLEKIRNGDGASADAGPGVPPGLGAPRGAGVSDGALRHLSDQVGASYRALAAARQTAPAPAPGPRTPEPLAPEPLPVDKPVEVEIRQGGGPR